MVPVNQMYVGLFEYEFEDGVFETTMKGFIDGEEQYSICFDFENLPKLIAMCENIAAIENLKWRIVQFDRGELIEHNKYRQIGYC